MFVCASTECFPDPAAQDVLQQLIDLEFTAVELAIHESGGWLKPSEVAKNVEKAVHTCRSSHRLDIAALSFQLDAEPAEYYAAFEACCKLAKAMKVVTLVVSSSELGTPFNEEIERLQELVRLAALESAVVALKTEMGCMTQDPDTAVVLCNHVKGLKLTLDPSHYITGPHQGGSFDKVFPFVQHVHLRDSSRQKLQVRVGQGEVDYGKLIQQLGRQKYDRALSIHIAPAEGVDHAGELRKLRLLLESLL